MTAYDLSRYLNVRSAYGSSFAPDGTLALLMNTTGVAQAWSLTEPQGWPEQLTFYDDTVSFVDYSPERQELVFGMDEGGNERAQLYRLDADGHIHELTGMPDAKHRWGGWSPDGERFAFASNRRDEAVFDIYVQDRDATGDDAELVWEGDGWFSVGGFSPDGERLLVSEAHSSFDQDIYVLDIDSGNRSHLTPHEGKVRYTSASWGPEGEAVYLVTDAESDTLELARLSLEGDLDIVRSDEQWNIDGVALDKDSGRLVYSRNIDGYNELTVGELTGPTTIETFPTPDLPGGLAGGVSWGPDAERFAVSVTGRQVNTNVFVVEAETGESEQWTAASTAGIPRETFIAPEVVRFDSFDGREIPALFSLPESAANGNDADGDTPVIVDIHGGPESQRRPSFSGLTQYFLSRGYAVFEPNVRGSTGYGKAYTHLDDVERRMDSVKDLRAGVDWLHDHPAVDPNRIVAMGGSYGGFMVLAALTEYPDLWAAGVDVVGIANFVTFLENTGDWRRELREAEYGSLDTDREFLESISPINNVDRINAPLFVLHGANDPRVPVGEAEQIAEQAAEQGVPVEKLVFDDEGHGISKRENRIEAYTAVVEFLDDHV
ncbi:S9 family peptidase [Haloarcula marismortui]|uniref:Prolyl oligopeptidase family protein n=1 Tax=Haloarcula marismortui ATCC 33800 TaxID=662476 RepID=M0JXM3_9EURY|nr:S9 family peptidase [Haloarcula sinaiiensis]EMA13183.1 prolyl oligopeptidase family protein [Haloarcula sinaiiensis ATCC 33800]QUJ70846.1 S9 family peptidase [Haloarcula sinaiiensis ATCC 33800]